MQTQFKDVAHLYIGTNVMLEDKKWVLTSVSKPYKTNDLAIWQESENNLLRKVVILKVKK